MMFATSGLVILARQEREGNTCAFALAWTDGQFRRRDETGTNCRRSGAVYAFDQSISDRRYGETRIDIGAA